MKFHPPFTEVQKNFYGPILDAILKYYPIGIKSDVSSYWEYPGQVELNKIIIDNIHSKKNFKSWQNFDKEIGAESKKRTIGQTYATRPSFSSSLILKKFKHHELMHFKTIHYSVSLLGPFFTIYGVDETAITDKRDEHDLFYTAINVVTVSPYKEFESDFNFIKSKIEDRFPGYKFIPFRLHSMGIEGLFDPYKDNEEFTIYRALFDDFLNEYDTNRMRGDYKYGFDWVKNDGAHIKVTFAPPPDTTE
jgi:hypothetical protein